MKARKSAKKAAAPKVSKPKASGRIGNLGDFAHPSKKGRRGK